jgi:hypothetical protein
MVNFSGNSYVPMRLREDPEGTKPTPTRIVVERNCDHKTTICPTKDCIESWAIDWKIFFDRTGGGRQLKQIIL